MTARPCGRLALCSSWKSTSVRHWSWNTGTRPSEIDKKTIGYYFATVPNSKLAEGRLTDFPVFVKFRGVSLNGVDPIQCAQARGGVSNEVNALGVMEVGASGWPFARRVLYLRSRTAGRCLTIWVHVDQYGSRNWVWCFHSGRPLDKDASRCWISLMR